MRVVADGFEHDGKPYRSLTALAHEITGYPAISGPAWWDVAERPAATPKTPAPKSSMAKRTPDAPTEPASAGDATPDSASV